MRWLTSCDGKVAAVVTSKPLPPTDQTGEDEEGLQRDVGVQLVEEEQPAKEQAGDDTSPPGMDAIAAC